MECARQLGESDCLVEEKRSGEYGGVNSYLVLVVRCKELVED